MAEALVVGGQQGPLGLTVLYDERCPLCRRLQRWLAGQETLVPIRFLAADSSEAHARFPALDHQRTTRTLTVVAADGAVYEGERAWLVCGWTLPAWQPVTEHFGSGARLRLVRVAARVVDGYRHRLVHRSPAPGLPGHSARPGHPDRCERCSVAAPPHRSP